jgi:ABC-type cobalamin transport system permease subunit
MPSIVHKRLHRPRWFWIVPRVLLVTFITAFSFALSLLLGILGIVIGARLRGITPNMAFAYRHIAAPAAAIAGCIVLVSAITMEIRHYRQNRALAAIERTAGSGIE